MVRSPWIDQVATDAVDERGRECRDEHEGGGEDPRDERDPDAEVADHGRLAAANCCVLLVAAPEELEQHRAADVEALGHRVAQRRRCRPSARGSGRRAAPPTQRAARTRTGNSTRQSSVTCQRQREHGGADDDDGDRCCDTVLDSVEVNARCAPITSLLSRLTSAPVWVRVKNASDRRWTWAKTAGRRSRIRPSPMREER